MTPGITEAIAAADRADQAAAFHATWRRHLAALLAAALMPAAATLVFEEDEDTVTDDPEIRLICMRDPAGALLWYNPFTDFADHPDAVEMGEPPALDTGTRSALEHQLREAYDAACGGFDTAADRMTGANLLILTVPSPAPSMTHLGRRRAGEEGRDDGGRRARTHAGGRRRLPGQRRPG